VASTVATAIDATGAAAAGVVFRPVTGLEPLDFWVARRAEDERRAVLDFVETTVDADAEVAAGSSAAQ